MIFKSFRIENFKGIKDSTIKMSRSSGAQVYSLVGLNESGKTTILEAIHSFSPDGSTGELLAGRGGIAVPIAKRVPRHLIASFTGNVSVSAELTWSDGDKEKIIDRLESEPSLVIEPSCFPEIVSFSRFQKFENADHKGNFFALNHRFKVKGKGDKKWRVPTTEEVTKIRDAFYERVPDIAYFPTFVFDFPEAFYLTERGTKLDAFYRSVFQDVLDYDNRGFTIEKDIVGRVRKEGNQVSWVDFLTKWGKDDDQLKIEQIMDRVGTAITDVVIGRWKKIFKENPGKREIVVSQIPIEGQEKNAQGQMVPTNKHDVSVKFQVKDGTRRFNVNDRSLGFRWFFSFMLFTQFRVSGSTARPILFLFDEPASNLHASAQQKLIECFPAIAVGDHALMYSTHSHYMIDPRWLDNTFVVTNRADLPNISLIEASTLDDESLEITASPYRTFVNNFPSKTSYFQPILDRLEVAPSRFDFTAKSVIVEGKSDYYILTYGIKSLGKNEVSIIPGVGAGTFGSLVSLHVGWGFKCLFLFDDDRKGQEERIRYTKDYGLNIANTAKLSDFSFDIKMIEDVLDAESKNVIQKVLNLESSPSKSQILRFFQEQGSNPACPDLGNHFKTKMSAILDAIEIRMNS